MRDAVSADGLIPLVAGLAALRALLLDVGDFAVGSDFPVPSGHTPTGHCREPKESDKAHVYNLSGGLCNRRTYPATR